MRARRSRRLPLLLVCLIVGALLPQAANAAVIPVACTGLPTDIMLVQTAIDGAGNGDTVQLTGICDFALAAPHGGDKNSVAATAVLVRPGPVIFDLTIESGASEATILGNGLNAAFVIAPNATGTTIRNLTFVNVARAVVTINADETLIGAVGPAPSASGLRVIGTPLMDQAILGLAVDRNPATAPAGTVTVEYGMLGGSTASYLGQAAEDLTQYQVRGNYITYVAPAPDILDADIVGIDVRQINARPINNVGIFNNVVSMEHAQYPLSYVMGIRVDATTPNVAPLTGTVADYFAQDVIVVGNILGRLVELPVSPINDIQFAGRTGISLTGVGGFLIQDNEARTIHAVSILWEAGGGIVVSDSAFGNIQGNEVNVIAIPLGVPEGETTDFGGIGIMDEVASLYGDPIKPQTTHDINVTNNNVGVFPPLPVGIAQRGFVVAKADNINVTFNETGLTLLDALNIAPLLDGPAATLAPVAVLNSTFCNNIWDGTLDDPNEVSFGAGGGGSTGNSFPGGTPPNNSSCAGGGPGPTLVFIPTDNTPPLVSEAGPTSDCESFRLSQRPTANVTITMTTDAQTTPLTPTRVFTPLNWNVYQWMCATAVDDLVVEGTHTSVVTYSATSTDPVWAAMVPVNRIWTVLDNDFGLVNIGFPIDDPEGCPGMLALSEGIITPPPVSNTYTIVLTAMPPTDVVIRMQADLQLSVNDQSSDTIRFTPLNWNIPQIIRVTAVDDARREGTPHFGFVTHTSFSDTPMWNNVAIPKLPACITDNDGPGAPGVITPGPNACLNDPNVTLIGVGETGATVEIFEGGVLLGSTVVIAGIWTFGPTAFAEGVHVLSLRQTGADGIPGIFWGSYTFRVDTTAPAAPTITSPSPGDVIQGSQVTVSGTAEPFVRVVIRRNGVPVGTTTADGNGNWSITLHMSGGAVTLDAVAIDCAGNVSPPSPGVPITIIPPAPPVILTPAQGAFVRPDVFVSGTGPAGCTITVLEGATVLRQGLRVAVSGSWSTNITFSAGVHTIVAVAKCGTITSAPSTPRTFTVDNTPPTVALEQPPLGLIAHIANPVTGTDTEGEAADDNAVVAIEITYTDFFTGTVVLTQMATNCVGCPGPSVTFTDTPTGLDPIGVYRVGARAIDIAGNVSNLVTILRINVVA